MELPKLEFWFDYGCCLWDDDGAVDENRKCYCDPENWIDKRK